MCKQEDKTASTEGQASTEYVMIAGLVAAIAIYVLGLLYSGDGLESLISAWGGGLAQQVAGDRIDAPGEAWADR